jgi:hypothetical protein
MRIPRHPVAELALVTTIGFFSAVSIYPIALIESRSIKQLTGFPGNGLPEAIGIICAGLTFPFNFEFAYRNFNSLPTQWRIANPYGKTLIIGLALPVILSAGIPNCYYMIGNLFFKLIAFLVPAISAHTIITDWALRINLTRYKKTDKLYRQLSVLLLNLKFNNQFKADFNASLQSLTQSIQEAAESNQLTGLKSQIDLMNISSLIHTDLQLNYPRWGFMLSAAKFISFSVLTSLCTNKLYAELAPKAGACIFGSGFSQYFDDPNIICPNPNSTGESIGDFLGNISIGVLTPTVIFTLLSLFDVQRVSANNKYTCARTTFYAVSCIFIAFRAILAPYITIQNGDNNGDTPWLLYVSFIYLFYNFFNSAILGPITFKTIYTAINSVFKKLQHRLSNAEIEEAVPLNAGSITLEKAIGHCEKLKSLCLFQPEEVSQALDPEAYQPVAIEMSAIAT